MPTSGEETRSSITGEQLKVSGFSEMRVVAQNSVMPVKQFAACRRRFQGDVGEKSFLVGTRTERGEEIFFLPPFVQMSAFVRFSDCLGCR